MSASQPSIYLPGGRQAPRGRPMAMVARLEADPGRVVAWLPAIALTLLDAALTYAWLHTGIAVEGNPWLADLVAAAGAGLAMVVRVAVGTALVGLLALLARDHAPARRGLAAVTGVLALVVGWHLTGGAMLALA